MTQILLLIAVVLLVQALLVAVAAFFVCHLGLSIWLGKTGIVSLTQEYLRRQIEIAKSKQDVPDGMASHYRYWTDERGRRVMVPIDEYEQLMEARLEQEAKEDAEYAQRFVDGDPLASILNNVRD